VTSPALFAMMVLMAVVTTLATAPLLQPLHLKHDEPLCRYPSSSPTLNEAAYIAKTLRSHLLAGTISNRPCKRLSPRS
jgi:hypothetical protein